MVLKVYQLTHSKAKTLTLTIITMVNTFPLFNAFFIRRILYSIEALCKHVHKKGKIGGESIAKLGFDKSQSREIVFILHTTTTCTIANSTTFTYSWKLVTKM
jgi:hypothetical protein